MFPPLAEPEGLLVDGGIVDNLPVGTARELYPGATVTASDVGVRHELSAAHFPTDGVVSGWSALAARLMPGRHAPPSITTLLHRLTALGGVGMRDHEADRHITHELDRYGRFDFARGAEIVEAGYQRSLAALSEH